MKASDKQRNFESAVYRIIVADYRQTTGGEVPARTIPILFTIIQTGSGTKPLTIPREPDIPIHTFFSKQLNPPSSRFGSRQRHDFALLHSVQTGSGAHPASYFPGGKAAGA
jgi:hypothetical protein